MMKRRDAAGAAMAVLAILLVAASAAALPPANPAANQANAQRIHPAALWPNTSNIHGPWEWRNAGTTVMKCVQGLWDYSERSHRPPEASWPEFQLRVTVDHKSFYGFGNPYNAKLPLAPSGTVFPEGGPLRKVEIAERTWAGFRARYLYGDDGVMEMTVSRLTPAAVFDFASAKQVNLFGDLLFDYIPKGVKDVQPKPRHIAFPTADGIRVFTGPGEVDLSDMTEGWALVWFGEQTYLSATQLPTQQQYHWSNGTWPKRTLAHYDCPWLLVFGSKPKSAKLHEPVNFEPPGEFVLDDTCQKASFRYWEKRLFTRNTETGKLKGLTLSYDGPAGALAMMPLYGNRYVLMAETSTWDKGLPKVVANDCRRWSATLRAVPVEASETYALDDELSKLTVTVHIGYRELGNPFGERVYKVAPVPGILSLAGKAGLVSFSGKVTDLDCPGTSGPACGIAGTDTYSYVIDGLDRYLWQRQAQPIVAEKAASLVADIRKHTQEMFDAGILAPVIFSPVREVPNPYWRFGNTGQLAVTLERVRPFLTAQQQAQIVPYVTQQLTVCPFGAGQTPFWTGARREAAKWPEDLKESMKSYAAAWWPQDFYALGTWPDRYADLAGDGLTAALENALTGVEDWNLGPISRPQPPIPAQWAISYVGQLNAYLEQCIGAARLARHMGRRDLVDLAAYRFGRAAAQRIGCEELIAYLYDSRQLRIPPEIDNWSEVLVRRNGNGAFIPDDWKGAADDVRSVASLDASGAELCAFIIWRGHSGQFSPYMDITPETARLLADHEKARCETAMARMNQRLPSWWLTRGAKMDFVHGEALYSPPDNAWQLLLMNAWTLGADGDSLSATIDVPFCKGDLYYLQKLAAAAGAYARPGWTNIRQEADK